MKPGVCRKLLAGVAAAFSMMALYAVPALAADISSISLTFTDRYETGVIMEPDISCGTSGVSIDSITWSRDVENWRPGTAVTATLILSSDGEFASSYGSRTCRVSGAELSSAKKDGDNLRVRVSYEPVVQLAAPESAGWSNAEQTVARWKSVEYATGYEVYLYRDTEYLRTIDVAGTVTVDLSEYMTEDGKYDYRVRAVGKDRSDAKYRLASEFTESTDRIMEDMGDSDGYWRNYAAGKHYELADGSRVTGQWYKVEGKWYYFNDSNVSKSSYESSQNPEAYVLFYRRYHPDEESDVHNSSNSSQSSSYQSDDDNNHYNNIVMQDSIESDQDTSSSTTDSSYDSSDSEAANNDISNNNYTITTNYDPPKQNL